MRKVRLRSKGLQNVIDLESPIEVIIESLVGRMGGSSQLHTGFLVSHAADELIREITYVLGCSFGSLEVPSSRTGVCAVGWSASDVKG